MTSIAGQSQHIRNAGALRFLAILLFGWIAVRSVMSWTLGSSPSPIADMAQPPAESGLGAVGQLIADGSAGRRLAIASESNRRGARRERKELWSATMRRAREMPLKNLVTGGAVEEYSAAASTDGMSEQSPNRAAGLIPPTLPDAPARWSTDAWLVLRPGGISSQRGLSSGTQLGGSQAGIRTSYALGESRRSHLYARATVALAHPRQRELAVGVSHAPVVRLPVEVAVERRIAIGSEGRNAFAAMVVGGAGNVQLPARFRLDSYAQAGVVGARRRDGFADGAVVVDRAVTPAGKAKLHAGAIVAGAVQPGVSRIDVGPRLTLDLPTVGRGSRVALDWRFRVAGDARPGSGAALTIASHF